MSGPLVVAGADQLLLRTDHPEAERCRAELARFAELVTAPESLHTYALGDIGLWNAASAGLSAESVIDTLLRYSSAPVPHGVLTTVTDTMARFGSLTLRRAAEGLVLAGDEPALLDEVLADPAAAALVELRIDSTSALVLDERRGALKQRLVELRHPVDDLAAMSPGLAHPLRLDADLDLRTYQRDAVASWVPSGSGVIVLPCGAGKTVTALAAMASIGAQTLVLTTGQAALDQWRRELLRFTDADPADLGEYSARRKELRPITLTTYQQLATRRRSGVRHLDEVQAGDWGLVIYDEVHLLPSAVFQLTAGLQSRRRLGLTATLVREDGREADVFALVGPKRFDVPWKDLEAQGWLAPAVCTEIRVTADRTELLAHAHAEPATRPAVAAAVSAKRRVAERLLARHEGEPALVIGTHLDALERVAAELDLPIVTGRTPANEREQRYGELRAGRLPALVVSNVANVSLDLPEVSVAIQLSGSWGSRQEEAQRLGRIVRPKADGRPAHFYALVANDTVEVDLARRRQRFLTEQGYHYDIIDADAIA